MANTRWTDQLLIGKIGQIRLIYCTTITRLQIDAFMVKSKKLELWFNYISQNDDLWTNTKLL